MHNFTVNRNTGVVKEDDNHITFASGKLTIHIYLNQQGNVVGECTVCRELLPWEQELIFLRPFFSSQSVEPS